MLRGFLISEKDPKGPRRIPVYQTITVGRAADCGFVIDDGAASRKHIQIVDRNGDFHWKDLGSTNGTVLNGSRMLEGRLKSGDRLQVGDTVIRFELEEVDESGPSPDESTMFKQAFFDERGHMTTRRARGRAEDLLQALYSVVNEIATTYDTCDLIDRMLENSVNAVGAERGALFLTDATCDELRPCASCGQVHLLENGELKRVDAVTLRVSQTVVQRVLKNGESVLFKEGSNDSDFNAAESIIAMNLRSILCAPLRGKFDTLGILYLDSTRADRHFSDDDMLLATAVGKSAGLAVENAHMHRQILEKQRIEQEISFAWTIQQSFLVKSWPEEETRFQVYGETRPAKTVGGDFYDFARPDAHTVGILIGDVSGKGVPASLTMAQLLAEFRLRAQGTCSPSEVLCDLNHNLAASSQRGMFCTMCYICIDLETGVARCGNAGHHPAAIIGENGVRLLGPASGPPAGVLPDCPWVDEEFRLAPGETLLLYTDGIVEARKAVNGVPCEYGVETLLEVAGRFWARQPRELLNAINQEVQQYCAPATPHDDCTLMALRYLG